MANIPIVVDSNLFNLKQIEEIKRLEQEQKDVRRVMIDRQAKLHKLDKVEQEAKRWNNDGD